MVVALLGMVGLLVSTYLALFKLGVIGDLTCAVGSCQRVQSSRWADFLGIPVAVWGVGFYLGVLGLSLAGIQRRFEDSRGVALLLVGLSGWGVLFSGWLTYLELFVIHAICMWCVVSAIITLLIFIASVADWWSLRDERSGEPQPA